MLAKERLDKIVKMIEEEGMVQVKPLAHLFCVTEDLIRKDLKKLEHMQLIDRIHGGAERKKNKFEVSTIHHRMAQSEHAKCIIAEKAYAYLEVGDHLFLDTSSTSAHIARRIAQGDKEITVITDMLYNMQVLSASSHVHLISIGGNYNHYTGGFHSQSSIKQIEKFRVDKAFVSCRSVDLISEGLYEGFIDIGETKKAILDTAKYKIVATTKSKFENRGVFKFYALSGIDGVISDEAFSPQELEVFKKNKVFYL